MAMVNAIAKPTTIPIPTLVASEIPSEMSGLSVPISSTLLTCRNSNYSFSMLYDCPSGVMTTSMGTSVNVNERLKIRKHHCVRIQLRVLNYKIMSSIFLSRDRNRERIM